MNDHQATFGESGGLPWHRAYERAAVEQFLQEAASEHLRLQIAVEEAVQRAMEVREQHAADVEAAQDALGALTMKAHAEIERLEREHEHAVVVLREAAVATAEEIVAAARARAFGGTALDAPDAEVIDLRTRMDEISEAKGRVSRVAEAEGDPSP